MCFLVVSNKGKLDCYMLWCKTLFKDLSRPSAHTLRLAQGRSDAKSFNSLQLYPVQWTSLLGQPSLADLLLTRDLLYNSFSSVLRCAHFRAN